jgi:2'-5' RNA ligase
MTAEPLILTLMFDAESFARLDGLRRAHFPPALNHIPAHLTLFHHLPGDRSDEVVERLTASRPEVMRLRASGLRKLGRGVALEIEGRALKSWRGALADGWRDWLTPQDRQGFRPHVTIQNKVEPIVARALHDELQAGFQPFEIIGEGALLWRYLGGPWALEAEVAFRPAP